MSSSPRNSRIEGVLRDATADLQNAELPRFVFNKLVPVTTKASDVVPKVIDVIPVPLVDNVAALALSVPFQAVKFGYSILPHGKKDEVTKQEAEFKTALQSFGVDIEEEFENLNLDANATESFKLAALQEAELSFDVEIVGCRNISTSYAAVDPIVRVKYGGEYLEATDHKTIGNNRLLLSTSISDLFLKDCVKGLTLELCDSMASDDVLGSALVPPHDILDAHGESLTFPLLTADEDGFFAKSGGSIVIRIRRILQTSNTLIEKQDKRELVGLVVPYSDLPPGLEDSSLDDSGYFPTSNDEDFLVEFFETLVALFFCFFCLVPFLIICNIGLNQSDLKLSAENTLAENLFEIGMQMFCFFEY